MVVDTSGSMVALDLSTETQERTRLDAVKDVFVKFVQGGDGLAGRPDDSIGIVSFAGCQAGQLGRAALAGMGAPVMANEAQNAATSCASCAISRSR